MAKGTDEDLDQKVCYCFHVTRRKLLNFLRIERPRVASQLSQCGGAGTGCGWCIPFLKQLFRNEGGDLAQLTPDEYARRRRHPAAGRHAAARGLATLRRSVATLLRSVANPDGTRRSASIPSAPCP